MHIRIAKNKKLFEKGAKSYSVSVYEIIKINNSNILVKNLKSKKERTVRPSEI